MAFHEGDRIEITGIMREEPNPLPVGLRGTVRRVTNIGGPYEQIDVDWDDKSRRLMLLPNDPYRKI